MADPIFKCESNARPIYITEEDLVFDKDFYYTLQKSGIYRLIPKYTTLNNTCNSVFGSYAEFSKTQADRLISGFSFFEAAEKDYLLGRYREAIQNYEKALRLNYRTSETNIGLGWSYLSIGDYATSEFYFDKAIEFEAESPML